MAVRRAQGREPGPLSEPLIRTVHVVPRTTAGRIDLDRIAAALEPADLLESSDGHGWSYVIPHGGPVLADDGTRSTLVGTDDGPIALGSDPFDAIDQVCERYGIGPSTPGPARGDLPPFTGGLVGALAYDLARRVERVPTIATSDREQAHLVLRLADVILAVAPDRDEARLVVHPGGRGGDPTAVADAIARRLTDATQAGSRGGDPRATPRTVVTSLPRDDYLDAVATVLDHIGAGDAFQVNLTQRLTARWEGDTHALYRAMRANSPAPFGAALPSIGVASISPETFLAVDGHQVTTRPVKGTRPRAADPALDAAFADDLATAAKDRAENIMIVDLERNDLGRVAVPGSIRVPDLLDVEAHPTVWHLVSTVTGRLRDDVGYGELLRATFPCGSITGAPKVSAMSIIERLERVRRGWYCGAIGFLGPGIARLSVAIRTATLHQDGLVDHGAGGGIVADSDPEEELAESLDKAAAFLRAVSATHVSDADATVTELVQP